MNSKLIYFFLIGVVIYSIGCRKLDSNYRQFIDGGEITYIGKADSLRVRGGDQRAEVSWLLMSDPRVSGYKIYWDNRQDSVMGNLNKTDDVDSISVVITGLEEGTHDFQVILFDQEGHSSVVSSVSGKVYGSFYKESLINRTIKGFRRVAAMENAVEIVWEKPEAQFLFSELKYKDINGDIVTYLSYSKDERDTLKNIDLGNDIELRSAFKPDSISIDSFYTEVQVVQPIFNSYELDKSQWQNAELSDDSYEPAYSITRLWDGTPEKVGSYFRLQDRPSWTMPVWQTIDLGQKYYLTKMLVNQYQSGNWRYGVDSPKDFEVYGSNVKSTDWDDWTLLGTFESIKPSGLPIGQLTDADIAQNLSGEEYELAKVDKSFRYFRFKTLDTWDGDPGLMIAELTLWGY